MHTIDWAVMLLTLFGIVVYGVWSTRSIKSTKSYLHGDNDLPWWTIGLSIMATQASAITFLSTPGQAYSDGMRFAQFYFGLPVAMVLLAIFVLPLYYKLKVYTAYEFLEGRFDLKTRQLTAILFLLQRGLAAGITIYAPAIILSTILGWSLALTTLFIGVVVIFYTVMGGTKAVSVTQKQQMIVILTGMFIAAIILMYQLPGNVNFNDALNLAGKMGKLNVVDFKFDWNNKYNFWSGMIGGVFLFLSYFGTDQSQVQRYLSGKSLSESRLGLLFNGIIKVPMQFSVLFVGVLVFVFYQFNQAPIHFNTANLNVIKGTPSEIPFQEINKEYNDLFQAQKSESFHLMEAANQKDEVAIAASKEKLLALEGQEKQLRSQVNTLILTEDPTVKIKDNDYVFITFVTTYLPVGLVGLLLAVIFSAAMSSTASELSALATTTVVDLYRRSWVTDREDAHYLKISKWFTLLWGVIALIFAALANLSDNLIELVNIIGSLFYGVILGVFMIAFFLKHVKGNAAFLSALVSEAIVLAIFYLKTEGTFTIAYLWLNMIGCLLTMGIALLLQPILRQQDVG